MSQAQTSQDAPPREELERAYWIDGMDQTEIAEKWGTTQPRVSYWMRDYDIPTRRPGAKAEESEIPEELEHLFAQDEDESSEYEWGNTSADLVTMQRDILLSVAKLTEAGGAGPTGAEIFHHLNSAGRFTNRTNHGCRRNVAIMVNRGALVYQPHPEDGRAKSYHLTATGWELINDDVDWIAHQLTLDDLEE